VGGCVEGVVDEIVGKGGVFVSVVVLTVVETVDGVAIVAVAAVAVAVAVAVDSKFVRKCCYSGVSLQISGSERAS